MSGNLHNPEEWIEDLLLGRLLEPKVAASLTPAQLEVLGAHLRSEILFSPEIHKILLAKAQQVFKELTE
jgi:hypothetical protein